MKKSIIFCLALAAFCLAAVSCQKTKQVTYPEPVVYTGDIETSDVVDLGLSVDWASKNVGAENPEDRGDYFTWGGILNKITDVNISSYWDYDVETRAYVKYKTGGNVLDPEDDAATVNLGENYRLPAPSEIDELLNKCIWLYAIYNGVKGYVVTSTINGKSIFLPCAGYCAEKGFVNFNASGLYWTNISASVQGNGSDLAAFAKALSLWPDRIDCADAHKYLSCPVRAVAEITAP